MSLSISATNIVSTTNNTAQTIDTSGNVSMPNMLSVNRILQVRSLWYTFNVTGTATMVISNNAVPVFSNVSNQSYSGTGQISSNATYIFTMQVSSSNNTAYYGTYSGWISTGIYGGYVTGAHYNNTVTLAVASTDGGLNATSGTNKITFTVGTASATCGMNITLLRIN